MQVTISPATKKIISGNLDDQSCDGITKYQTYTLGLSVPSINAKVEKKYISVTDIIAEGFRMNTPQTNFATFEYWLMKYGYFCHLSIGKNYYWVDKK